MPGKNTLTAQQALALLTETPTRLAALTADLTPAQLRTSPGPDEWSLNDILAHLRACADMWGGCMARIIAEDRPTLRAINPQAWIAQTNYPTLEFQPSLRAFTAQRAELLAALGSLPPQGWARSAIVTGAGAVLERTVLFYARWLAGHERTHVKQIARMAATLRS
ncbi:MAG TPA: DinB family protein [Ktedonobacterales bacterium]